MTGGFKKMDVEEWILKHFKMTRDVMTSENNIAYTNMRCQAVSSEVRRRLGKKDKYEVGRDADMPIIQE